MKVRFYCDSGANIHSKREDEFDLSEIGFTKEQWMEMTEEEKMVHVNEWANDRLEIGFEELED